MFFLFKVITNEGINNIHLVSFFNYLLRNFANVGRRLDVQKSK